MDILFFSVLCLLCLCVRLFTCALWSPAGKGLTSWLSFVMSNCEFVTILLLSWFRCGTLLYRFLILSDFINLTQVHNFMVIAQDIFTFRRLSVFTVSFTRILRVVMQIMK